MNYQRRQEQEQCVPASEALKPRYRQLPT
uniref:Uncharacterized protein n=1 Tax=Moniliophthora roreri TaxID=221103 RepID=A0A0W0FF09_MONRR